MLVWSTPHYCGLATKLILDTLPSGVTCWLFTENRYRFTSTRTVYVSPACRLLNWYRPNEPVCVWIGDGRLPPEMVTRAFAIGWPPEAVTDPLIDTGPIELLAYPPITGKIGDSQRRRDKIGASLQHESRNDRRALPLLYHSL